MNVRLLVPPIAAVQLFSALKYANQDAIVRLERFGNLKILAFVSLRKIAFKLVIQI